jgi:hypothetical protein
MCGAACQCWLHALMHQYQPDVHYVERFRCTRTQPGSAATGSASATSSESLSSTVMRCRLFDAAVPYSASALGSSFRATLSLRIVQQLPRLLLLSFLLTCAAGALGDEVPLPVGLPTVTSTFYAHYHACMRMYRTAGCSMVSGLTYTCMSLRGRSYLFFLVIHDGVLCMPVPPRLLSTRHPAIMRDLPHRHHASFQTT